MAKSSGGSSTFTGTPDTNQQPPKPAGTPASQGGTKTSKGGRG